MRILGSSRMAALNAVALVVLTGNGLLLSEDLARRFVVIELDARTEDPEARPFTTDMKAACRDDRARLLTAALTIWRWGRLSLDQSSEAPLGGFPQWSRWVRDPLVALGCADPVARVGETKSRDSKREAIREIFELWWCHHRDRPMAMRELHEEVRQAIDPFNRARQWLTARRETLSGTRMAGWVLMRQPAASKSGVTLYALQRTNEAEPHPDHREHRGERLRSEVDGLDGRDAFSPQPGLNAAGSTSLSGSGTPDASQTSSGPEWHPDHRDHQGEVPGHSSSSDASEPHPDHRDHGTDATSYDLEDLGARDAIGPRTSTDDSNRNEMKRNVPETGWRGRL